MSNGKISIDQLLSWYERGVYPMAESRHSQRIILKEPSHRTVIIPEKVHIPSRLRRFLRHAPFKVTCNQAFERVIDACAEPRVGQTDTWINPHIRALYHDLFEAGYAHSIEVWQEDELVGGLYGVAFKSAFAGESMFTRANNAGKVALVHLLARLVEGGYRLLDSQIASAHFEQFGGHVVTKAEYQTLLKEAMRDAARFPVELTVDPVEILGRSLN